jgi:DNA-binding NtrC family response regulator
MTILITAYKSEDVVSEARQLGIHDFIEKPFTTNTIEESLARLVKERDQSPARGETA